MATSEGRKAYDELRTAWQQVNQEAREARAAATQAFALCAAPNGTGATEAQIDLADQNERKADMLSIQLDNLARTLLGLP